MENMQTGERTRRTEYNKGLEPITWEQVEAAVFGAARLVLACQTAACQGAIRQQTCDRCTNLTLGIAACDLCNVEPVRFESYVSSRVATKILCSILTD